MACIRFTLGVFNRDASGVKTVADGAHYVFFFGGLEDVVILVIGRNRFEVFEIAVAQRLIAVLEQVEFQFSRHHRLEPQGTGAFNLTLQNRAGGVWDGVMVVIEQVGQTHRGAGQPRQWAQGGKIGLHHVIAVARLPVRRFVAGHGIHFHINCQQVVAGMGFFKAAIEKERGVKAFAH